ncbi:MAG: peptidoglycan-binding protein, partial [Cytophagales bacterium CG18_big_fil_WC_8_21_14_2_50_42_9]
MNGRQLSVRVIGTLPNTGSNDKVIVKLSRKAQQRLAALDNRFLVDVVYAAQ